MSNHLSRNHKARNPEVQQILDEKIDNIAGVRGAVVLSDEGVHMYWSILDDSTAERRAPMASVLGNLADRYAAEERGGAVRRVILEMEDGFVVVGRIGHHSYLALSVEQDANLGTIAYESTLLTKRLAHVLDAELRTPAQGGANT
ncbi:roadblock/LC7 domain-containing protein [Streptomyces oceani]|uniref:Roadblock/LAMTOR2 domain-containing protein n=1 Tax=Streptomyces oceani TaxID=1075402 RepID=A0A1E7KQ10_9ACTN|nr:roadblock/LC7 domain-containing protein [Streptomyces oceani]OEV06029.1 hypothetical protein AN216_00720 [Streptomyces oceani]